MPNDTIEPFGFPAAGRRKLIAAFDGGRITSDGGVMLLVAAEAHRHCAGAGALVTHSIADILHAWMLAISCGYEDANDLDHLRTDPDSSWLADGCPTAAAICARNRPCRAWRMRRRCARWCT